MLNDLQKYLEEKNYHITYYRNSVKLLEYFFAIINIERAQMLENEKTQASTIAKANSDKTELAGALHQIKSQLIEKGLVSAEELDQYKEKIAQLGSEVDKLKKELAKKPESPINSPRMTIKMNRAPVALTTKKDQGVITVERGSNDKAGRDAKTFKTSRGMAAIYDDFATGYIEPLEWTMQIVDLIYIDKYYADIDDIKESRTVKTIRDYVPEWFLSKFGIKRYSEIMMKDFLKSVSEYAKDYERFALLTRFLGINIANSKQSAEFDKVDLRKIFFQSPDVNFQSVKLIYRLRAGCCPYLPVLQVKNASTVKLLEDLGNFVSIEKGKKVFVQFMKECGYNEDRFVEFNDMMKYLAEQEPKHPERYAALKETADLKKVISFDGYLNACINQYINVRVKDTETLKASFQILESGTECILISKMLKNRFCSL